MKDLNQGNDFNSIKKDKAKPSRNEVKENCDMFDKIVASNKANLHYMIKENKELIKPL